MITGRFAQHPDAHPILVVLDQQGRTIAGLARVTGFSRNYLSLVFNGRRPVTHEVREACARALGLDASELFHHDVDSSADTPAA